MNKFGIITILVTILILGGGAFLVSKNSSQPIPTPEPSTYEYFWGDGCPHCVIVADFFETWEGKDKIKIKKLEVWNNKSNATIMAERAKTCGVPLAEMGVPLLVAPDGKCYIGDQPIIEHYKSLEFN